jgi:hypothetical protein
MAETKYRAICIQCGEVFERGHPGQYRALARLCSNRCSARRKSNLAIAKIDQRYQIDQQTGCWVWNGPFNYAGYARLKYQNRTLAAYRWFYERAKGKIPDGLAIDHLCCNKNCVNPDHLEAVTHAENKRRWARHKVPDDVVRYLRSVDVWSGRGCPPAGLKQKTFSELAREVGVSYVTVQAIIRGQPWRG